MLASVMQEQLTELCSAFVQWVKRLNAPLSEVDPELVDIIEKEKNRQWKVAFALDIYLQAY